MPILAKFYHQSEPSKAKYAAFWTGHQVARLAYKLKNLACQLSGIHRKFTDKNIVILLSGGPAPGVPNAIRSAAVIAMRNGFKVYGARRGVKSLIAGEIDPLTYGDVWHLKQAKEPPITSTRRKPTRKDLEKISTNLENLKISGIITIGGDGTAALARCLQVLQIPVFSLTKTIDNDVLPSKFIGQTFGFDTAAEVIAYEIENLVVGAKMRQCWFFVRTMGRASGALAQEAARRGGAEEIYIIPEQFEGQDFSIAILQEKVKAIMEERARQGKNFGVIVLSEGLEVLLLKELKACGIRIDKDPSGQVSQDRLEMKCHDIAVEAFEDQKFRGRRIILKNLGYEARTANPTPTDIRLTSLQGRWAIRSLLRGKESSLVTVKNDQPRLVPFSTPGIFDTKGNLIKRQAEIE